MRDIMGMMKQAKEMQAKMQNLQAELADVTATGQAGGDMVKITLSGDAKMKAAEISGALLRESEKEILEDLLVAAYNDAKEKIDAAVAAKTREITAGLPLPAGFKLPF